MSDEVVGRYDDEIYGPRSYASAMWRLQQPFVSSLLADERGRRRRVALLDFACGTGRVLSFCEPLVDSSVGVDISPAMARSARARCSRSEVIEGDLLAGMDLPRSTFHVITAFRFFLNTEPDVRRRALCALRDRLDDDGLLIANVHGSTRSVRHFTLAYRRLRTRAGTSGADLLNELSPADFRRSCEAAGFRVVAERGFGVLPPMLYRTRLGRSAARVDGAISGGRIAQRLAIDVVFACRAAKARPNQSDNARQAITE
jgi:SAM-dependent methyltransferase